MSKRFSPCAAKRPRGTASGARAAGAVFAMAVAAALFFPGLAHIFSGSAQAGEVPASELKALDRAIARELNKGDLGSQTLIDLERLRNRLDGGKATPTSPSAALSPERVDALEPLQPLTPGPDGSTLARLEAAAAGPGENRAAQRSLALYLLYEDKPEEALAVWRKMGAAHPGDVAHKLLASYLELAMGEYGPAQAHLDDAARTMRTRTKLELSPPVFCTNIAGYRIYETRGKKEILPGEDTLIYIEVEGADFRQLPDGMSECLLMFGLSLRNDAGVILWSEPNYGEYDPLFTGPIRDLHTALSWRIPNDLVPGRYTLTVEAVEESSQRRGESSLAFDVARRGTNPETRPGARMPPGYEKTLQDAGKLFPGAPAANPFGAGERLLNPDARVFDTLQKFEQDQRVERR